MRKVGELLREQREIKGLLLRQVAAKLDLDQAILSKIERGERRATKEQIVALACFYKLDEKHLMAERLSNKVVERIENEDTAIEALKIAERKMNYLKKNENG